MEDKLNRLFGFLQENRRYNKNLQERYYSSIILPKERVVDKVVSLLYHIANTQSQPRIDYLAKFYKNIHKNIQCLESFESFIDVLLPNAPKNFNGIFQCIKCQPGWGDKTSALFTKSIYHLHNNNYPQELRIWKDVPSEIKKDDIFYVPVDAVITTIFKILDPKTNWNFSNTNKLIKQYFSGKDIEVWDDLWYWGFITQKGTGTDRELIWNENKYWTLMESDKDSQSINKVKSKAVQFLSLLKKSNEK